jgi:hypothetical protein
MADTNTAPVSTAEDESNSVFSHDDGGSSGEDTTHHSGPAVSGKKRKREKYQKTSYVASYRTLSYSFPQLPYARLTIHRQQM